MQEPLSIRRLTPASPFAASLRQPAPVPALAWQLDSLVARLLPRRHTPAPAHRSLYDSGPSQTALEALTCRRPWTNPFPLRSSRARLAATKRAAAAGVRERRLAYELLVSEALSRAAAQHAASKQAACCRGEAAAVDPFARRLAALTTALRVVRDAAAAEQTGLDAAWTVRDER